MSDGDLVRIHYLRPPDHEQVFEQRVVLDRADVVVTLAESISFAPPLRIDDRVVLEDGSDVVWFTFPGAWHDVGRFHTASGRFTGFYANILTPPRMEGRTWWTTDLFLDVWQTPDGSVELLDEHEYEEAVARGRIDAETAARAREEADRLLRLAADGAWPPPVVQEWTLERARAARESVGVGQVRGA